MTTYLTEQTKGVGFGSRFGGLQSLMVGMVSQQVAPWHWRDPYHLGVTESRMDKKPVPNDPLKSSQPSQIVPLARGPSVKTQEPVGI